MSLSPLYKLGDKTVYVGLAQDHKEKMVDDGLLIEINLDKKSIGNPWSGQKLLKFCGYMEPVLKKERKRWEDKIKSNFTEEEILNIEDILINPPVEAVKSLIWVPKRLKKRI